jgi:hypothetical protein
MSLSPPQGITPPTPGAEREEPEFAIEADIPSDDGGRADDTEPAPERTPLRDVERE